MASVVAAASLYYTQDANRQVISELDISREGHITAVANLGEDTVAVRIGGVYALQRIMHDSPRDQPTITILLTEFARTSTVIPPEPGEGGEEGPLRPPADVVAAVKVVAFRDTENDDDVPYLDLSGAHLQGIDLSAMSDSDGNRLPAQLAGADLNHTNLADADLTRADLTRAYLADVDLAGAYLTDARVSVDQLLTARITPETVLPTGLADNSAIQEHIASD